MNSFWIVLFVLKLGLVFCDENVFPIECGEIKYNENNRNSMSRSNFANAGQFPWMAAFGYATYNNLSREFTSVNYIEYAHCAGTLITDQIIITDSYCLVDMQKMGYYLREVLVGTNSLFDPFFVFGVKAYAVDYWIESNIDQTVKYNNLGLIKLSSKVEFSEYIQPICIQHEPNEDDLNDVMDPFIVDVTVQIPGYYEPPAGEPDLQYHNMTILSPDDCDRIDDDLLNYKMCVEGPVCDVNSGNPVQLLNPMNGRYYLWGVTSSEDTNCDRGLYTRIFPYVDVLAKWIKFMS